MAGANELHFVAEAREHLAQLSAALVELERLAPGGTPDLANILRSAHSLKGGAGFSGFRTIERLAHAMESTVEDLRDGRLPLGAEVIDALLYAVDRAGALVDDLGQSANVDISEPLERLRGLGADASTADAVAPIDPTGRAALVVVTRAESAEFTLSQRVLDAWPQDATHLYGVKLDWRQCERNDQAPPLEAARRLEAAGRVLECRMRTDGASRASPLWYWAIVASALPVDEYISRLGLPSAAVVQLQAAQRRNETGPGGAAAPARPQAAGASLRVPVPLIDRMMALAGELVLVRNQATLAGEGSDANSRNLVRRLDAITNDLQDAALRMRMQPLGVLFDRFPRLVRDLARQFGKQIELLVSGTEVELDKTILEQLVDPLTHLVRNSCDHGIEPGDQRIAAGKPATGRIQLSGREERGQIVIEITDDGRGLDADAIRRKALQKCVRQAEELDRLSERQLFDLIFLSGFSTAAKVTDVSGRGVGMDVVRNNLEQIGGVIEIDSVTGVRTTFTLRLPLTLAIMPCLLIQSGGESLGIPQRDIEEVVRLETRGTTGPRIEYADNEEVLRSRERLIPIVRLSTLTAPRAGDGTASAAQDRRATPSGVAAGPGFVAILKVGGARFGLLVENVLRSEEMVIKPLHTALRGLGIYSGATILGDGRVALLLSAEGLARRSGVRHRSRPGPAAGQLPAAPAPSTKSLLFRSGQAELLAAPLDALARIVPIRRGQIERAGEREIAVVDGAVTNVLRIEQFLRLTPMPAQDHLYLILPRSPRAPTGILASRVVDTLTHAVELDRGAYQADGVLGTSVHDGQVVLHLDVHRFVELWLLDNNTPPKALPTRGRRRILVVDDASFFRQLISGYLEADGHAVVTAADGREALERLSTAEFDLIVSDIEMPVMDGLTLARNVRAGASQPPMLALTSLSKPENRAEALAAGFDAYEIKLDRGSLIAAVHALLAVERPSGAAGGR